MTENKLVFLTASEIRFGRGKACEVAVAAKAFGARVMLVNGLTAARSNWLADQLTPVARFSVGHEPDIAMIEAGVAAARAAKHRLSSQWAAARSLMQARRLQHLCRPVCR